MIAEKAVLGSMLKENYLIAESNLVPSQFLDTINRTIFQSMSELIKAGKSADVVTMLTTFSPQDLGGANYLNDLPNFAHIEKFDDHVKALLEVWRNREKKNILQIAVQEDWGIERITSELGALTDNRVNDHTDISSTLAEIYEAPYNEIEIKSGAPVGIHTLDKMTNGFHDGELVIIAARPSMGKSDVMLQISKESGRDGYLPVIFSLEMPTERLRDRLIASSGGISRSRMRDPYRLLTEQQKENWPKTIGVLSKTNIQFFDGSGQTVNEIKMKVRKLMSKHPGLKPIILIDYLTLIGTNEKYNNKHAQVSQITEDLKGMARDFKCPVVTLAQLSREVEKRHDKRPMMSDLRESGSIEEDADVIIFLYRNAYYTKDENDNVMELIVSKNRNGPVGTALCVYNKFTGEVMNIGSNSEGAAI